ncbi:MAG: beta-ketoacyl synthase N-terminal-like domain-containing protein [Elusimicrobiota bacterium]
MKEKILVTGMGMVSALGLTTNETWAGIIAGKTGISFNPLTGLSAGIPAIGLNGHKSRAGEFIIKVAKEALTQAQLLDPKIENYTIGCAIGQSKPLIDSNELSATMLLSSFSGWSMEALVKKEFKLEGPSTNIVAACATGIACLSTAEYWLQNDLCDAVIVGASESSLNPLYQTGFRQMGVLCEGDSFLNVCPFDEDRSGFAMGEGASVLILEKEGSAQKRNVQPIAILEKTVMLHNTYGRTGSDKNGKAIGRVLSKLLGDVKPNYINLHGTGTVMNDASESMAIEDFFNTEAKSIPVSSTKAATGHLLGAAGAIEAAIAVLALRDQILPPTLNLKKPIRDLDFVPNKSRLASIQSAASLSYGFGGQLGGVLFSKRREQ